MKDYQLTDLQALLIRHEGMRLKPYTDSVGKLTIGVGRNLDDKAISEEEAIMLLNRDIADAIHDVRRVCSVYDQLSPSRQMVLVSMAFNMGYTRLNGFVHFLNALHQADYDQAADEMLNSKWAGQVGMRANELADMMRSSTSTRI